MSKEAKEKKDSVSEDLARLFGVTTDDMKRLFDLSEEQLMKLDEVEFRGRVRERCHHTMEIPTYESAFYNTPLAADQTATMASTSQFHSIRDSWKCQPAPTTSSVASACSQALCWERSMKPMPRKAYLKLRIRPENRKG